MRHCLAGSDSDNACILLRTYHWCREHLKSKTDVCNAYYSIGELSLMTVKCDDKENEKSEKIMEIKSDGK